jgi:ubiquinone biosynthesis monooxygenase Coq7
MMDESVAERPAPRHGNTTCADMMVMTPTTQPLPAWLVAELRSDHAGETGAVRIYDGILALSHDPALRSFAQRHRETEQRHLRLLEEMLPRQARSHLLPLWRLAGWLTGALPALFGPYAVYATIDVVESFVDRHYGQQIERLDEGGMLPEVAALLKSCREDEVHHRDEAREAAPNGRGVLLRLWCLMVAQGSTRAVALAQRL